MIPHCILHSKSVTARFLAVSFGLLRSYAGIRLSSTTTHGYITKGVHQLLFKAKIPALVITKHVTLLKSRHPLAPNGHHRALECACLITKADYLDRKDVPSLSVELKADPQGADVVGSIAVLPRAGAALFIQRHPSALIW